MSNYFQSAYGQLSPVERAFVDAYTGALEDRAIKGLKPIASAFDEVQGTHDAKTNEMLSSALVRAAISERVRELADSAELSVYRTLKEIRAIAYSNMGDYFSVDEKGEPFLNMSGITPDKMGAIKSIETQETRDGCKRIKIVMFDKTAMLTILAKQQGIISNDDDQRYLKLIASEPAKSVMIETIEDAANEYARSLE